MNDRPAETVRFEDFGPRTIDWFAGLEKENTKSYFGAHRSVVEEQVREPMRALLSSTAEHSTLPWPPGTLGERLGAWLDTNVGPPAQATDTVSKPKLQS